MADLSQDASRPSVSPEGLLRGLGVVFPGSGVSWAPGLQAVAVVHEIAAAQAFVANPEAGFFDTAPAVVGEFGCFQIQAGPLGCWVNVTSCSSPALQAIMRFDSPDTLNEALILPVPLLQLYAINDPVETTVTKGGLLVLTGPQVSMNNVALNTFQPYGRSGFWVPPGGLLRFIHTTIAVVFFMSLVVRTPLAAP